MPGLVYCGFGLWLFSFLRWNFSPRSRTIKTNHTCNLQGSPTYTSFFYAGIPNHSVEGIIHFKGNIESAQHERKKKFQPYNRGFWLILSKALARSSYTSVCIIWSTGFSIQVSSFPLIFWPSHGCPSQIRCTKVQASKIKQSPNYSSNFYTRVASSLQFVAMTSFMACVTNEVPSIRWSLPVIISFCSKHITSISLPTDLVLFFQDLGKTRCT